MATLYVALPVTTMDEASIVEAGDDAELLLYRAMQMAKRGSTSGALTRGQLQRLHVRADEAIAALVREGLMREEDGLFVLVGWEAWCESRDMAAARLERERSRKTAWRTRQERDVSATRDTGVRDVGPARLAERRDRDRDREVIVKPPKPPRGRRNLDSLVDQNALTGDERTVWDHYLAARKHHGMAVVALTAERAECITGALRLEPIDRCRHAISGMFRDPHNRGEDGGKVFVDLKYALGKADRITRHADAWEQQRTRKLGVVRPDEFRGQPTVGEVG